MKEIAATATGTAESSLESTYSLLLNVERYPQWYPDGVKQVEVLERDGEGVPTLVQAVLNAVAGPIRKQFEVRLAVEPVPREKIALARVADDRGDHELLTITWLLRELAPTQTEITVQMGARLDVPMFLPIDPVAREVAGGFLQAAIAAV